MATFDLSDTSRRAQATGDGSNVTFPFSFQVNATSDVKVYVGGTLKTLSTHYTIVDSSNAAGLNTNGTGTVKFITSPTDYTPASGDVVTILSDVPVARTSVYTSGGNITAAALESDFDTQAMMLGDREERETRTVMAPVNDPTDVNMVLPAKADRLGKVLGFNSSTGNPEAVNNAALTNAEVRAAVEAASDSNVFTDADHSKLDGIAASANNYSHPNHSGDVTSSADGATTIAADAVTGAKIADDAVDSEHIADGSIDTAHIGDDQVTYAKIQNVSATNVVLGRDSSGAGVIEEISASSLRTILNVEDGATSDQSASEIEAIVNHDNLQGFVANEHIDWTASSAGSIHLTNLPATALTTVQTASSQSAMLALTTQEGDVVVRSDENKTYMHNGGSAGTMADFTLLATPTDAVTSVDGATGAITLNHDTLTGFVANEHIDWTTDQGATNIHAGNYTDTTYTDATTSASGLMSASDKTKLDGVEAAATADQTAAEIRTLVESASDSNVFTDADHTKLNGIESNATADQTASEIKTAYESNSDTNAFTDADHSKLDGIAASANNYTHPNHSGEVTSSGDGATVIADNVVDEANLKVSNSPTDGYVLTARSGNTGGLTWEAASGGGGDPDLYRDNASSTAVTPTASGTNAVALGSGAVASGNLSFAFGSSGTNAAISSGAQSISMGSYSRAYASTSIAMGYSAEANSNASGGVAIGQNSRSAGSYAVALGQSYASGVDSFAAAIGNNSSGYGAKGNYSVAMGETALTQSNFQVAIGHGATGGSVSNNAIALGQSYVSGADSFAAAIANNTSSYGSSGANSIAFGDRSKSTGSRGIAIGGYGALASGTSSLAFGYQATANQSYASGFGYASKAYGAYSFAGTESHASGSKSVALGLGDTSTSYGALHDNGVALGYQATTSAAKQIALGSSTAQVKVSGAYTLPTTDGSANQVLTAAGDGTTSWAAASGGGGGNPDLYSDSANGSAVTPTSNAGGSYNSVAIGNGADIGSARGDSIAIGTDALANQSQALAIGRSATVNSSGTWGTAVGRNSVVNGQSAVALGNSYSGGTDSFAVGIDTNSSSYGATGAKSRAIGEYSKSSANNSTALGYIALASAQYSMTLGHNSTASATYAHANGYQALADEYGECVWANGKFANQGDAQTGKVVLRGASSSASVLTLGANGSATTWPISDNSAYTFTAMFVARRKASEGTESAAVRFEGLLRKEGNDASVTLVNSTKTVISNSPNWTISISSSAGAAGENNGGLDVIFYDSNGWNVRCVCTIEYTKVTYA